MSASVSVVIPAYNAEKDIVKAVHSVLAQSLPVKEIIVVDDGSKDNTRSVVEQLIGPQGFSGKSGGTLLKYVYQENRGPAAARNRGIRTATGDWIAFLDSDDTWLPQKIERQLQAAAAGGKNLGLVCSGRYKVEESTGEKTVDCRGKALTGRAFEDLWGKGNFIVTSSVLVRKACFEALGFFDESPEVIGAEDFDMWLRIADQYGVFYINEPLVVYRVSWQGLNRSNIDRAYLRASFVLKKHQDKVKKYYKNYQKILKKTWLTYYTHYGLSLFDVNRVSDAQEKFKMALTYDRFHFTALRYYLLASLGEGTIKALKRAKNGVSAR